MLAAAVVLAVGAAAVAADADGPLAEQHVGGTARPVRFVEPAGAPPADAGAVWFLTLSTRRLSWVDRAIGKDRPRVVIAGGAGPFDADGAFAASESRAREVAIRLDPGAHTVVTDGVRATGLVPGDVIVEIGGQRVRGLRRAEWTVHHWKLANGRCGGCGDPLDVRVLRDGDLHDVRVLPPRPRERAVAIPLRRRPSVTLPEVGDVSGGMLSGPSAGLPFTLAYLDRTTGGQLLGGRQVAATGVLLDAYGTIGAVSGLEEKIGAAVAAGADVVFVPAANRHEVPAPAHVPVVAVANVDDAVQWLCADADTGGCGPLAAALGGLSGARAEVLDDLWRRVPRGLLRLAAAAQPPPAPSHDVG